MGMLPLLFLVPLLDECCRWGGVMVMKDASAVLLGMLSLLLVWVVCWHDLEGEEARIHLLTHCCLQAQ